MELLRVREGDLLFTCFHLTYILYFSSFLVRSSHLFCMSICYDYKTKTKILLLVNSVMRLQMQFNGPGNQFMFVYALTPVICLAGSHFVFQCLALYWTLR